MAKDHITFQGGPLHGLSFQAAEWPPRPEFLWEEVKAGADYHGRPTPLRGRYTLQSHSLREEPYADDEKVFRGGRYIWNPEPPDGFVDGETQRAHLN